MKNREVYMKKMRKNKGFTLVELLAVIIVLTIVMVIAVISVVPLINKARVGAFASSANNVIATVETLVIADEINGNNYNCYTLDYLIDKKYIDKLEKASGSPATKGFSGVVQIDKTTASYKYTIILYDFANKYLISASHDTNTIPVLGTSVVENGTAPAANTINCSGFNSPTTP